MIRLLYIELEAKLENQVSWVKGHKPATALSLSLSGEDGDGWDLYIWYTSPWGFWTEENFHIFHVNPKDGTFSTEKARTVCWWP